MFCNEEKYTISQVLNRKFILQCRDVLDECLESQFFYRLMKVLVELLNPECTEV